MKIRSQIEKLNIELKSIIFRNSIYSLVQFLIPTLILLLFTPFLVHKMGPSQYGLWMIALSALGLSGIADFGLSTSISKYVAEYYQNSTTSELFTVITLGFFMYFIIGVIFIFPIYYFSPQIAGFYSATNTITNSEINNVIKIISIGFLPMLLRTGAFAIPIGMQKFKIPTIISILYQFFTYSTALLVASLGGTISEVVISTIIVLWLSSIISLFMIFRMLQPIGFRFSLFNYKFLLHKMIPFTMTSWISELGSQLFNVVDKLVVASVMGFEIAGYYTVIISIASKIMQLNGMLMRSLMPAASSWYIKGEISKIRNVFRKSFLIQLCLNLSIAGIYLLLSSFILSLWMGDDFSKKALLPSCILVVIYSLFSLNASAYYIAYGIGKPGINAFASIVGGASTIGLIFVLGKDFGLLGAALANGGYIFTLIINVYVFIKLNSMITNDPSKNSLVKVLIEE